MRVANLFKEVVEQEFSLESFDIKFKLLNDLGIRMDSGNIKIVWNNTDVSSDLQNLGSEFYSIALEPITVNPGEDPIFLLITANIFGYQEKTLEIALAVDPNTISKNGNDQQPNIPFSPIIGFPLVIIIITIFFLSSYFTFK
ncbi:MAG: hypothetical protein ACTSPH_13270 [Promethearchaeota archaeon]